MIANIVWVESDIQAERHVKLVEKDEDENPNFADERAFISTGERNHRYVPIAVALTNEEWRANLLKAAERDMNAFIAKYNRLTELAIIIQDMNDFLGA